MPDQRGDELERPDPPGLDYAPPREGGGGLPGVTLLLGVISIAGALGGCLFIDATRGGSLVGFPVALGAGLGALATGYLAARRPGGVPVEKERLIHFGRLFAGVAIVFVIVAGVGLSRMGRPREAAQRIKCHSNLRQIGQALRQYWIDFEAAPPDLATLLAHCGVGPTADLLLCPNADGSAAPVSGPFTFPDTISYVIVRPAPVKEGDPAMVVVAIEPPGNHGGEGGNVLYADGASRFVTAAELEKIVRSVQAEGDGPANVDLGSWVTPD